MDEPTALSCGHVLASPNPIFYSASLGFSHAGAGKKATHFFQYRCQFCELHILQRAEGFFGVSPNRIKQKLQRFLRWRDSGPRGQIARKSRK